MVRELRQGLLFTLVMMSLVGGAYHAGLWAVGRLILPARAEGSLITSADGTVVGSRLIAQKFTRPEYFAPRPSAVDYNAASTGGSNYGPSNPDHLAAVEARVQTFVEAHGVRRDQLPSELVTASGAGLDPHIPPGGAELQAPRVAASRGIDVSRVRERIAAHIERPTFGLLGRARVNVLELNMDLDQTFGAPAAAIPSPDRTR